MREIKPGRLHAPGLPASKLRITIDSVYVPIV